MAKSNWDGLEKLQKNVKKLGRKKKITMDKLFSHPFMEMYTAFSSIDEFFEEGGFEIESERDFEKISEEKLDTHVKRETSFASWNDMKAKAGTEWVKKELGF